MELKQFIKETVTAIVDGTSELQAEYEGQGVLINPPTTADRVAVFLEGSEEHRFRYVEKIDFDVAVTVASEKSGGGGGGLKVAIFEAKVNGEATTSSEHISRVRFSLPIALKPTEAEARHLKASEQTRIEQEQAWNTSVRRGVV